MSATWQSCGKAPKIRQGRAEPGAPFWLPRVKKTSFLTSPLTKTKGIVLSLGPARLTVSKIFFATRVLPKTKAVNLSYGFVFLDPLCGYREIRSLDGLGRRLPLEASWPSAVSTRSLSSAPNATIFVHANVLKRPGLPFYLAVQRQGTEDPPGKREHGVSPHALRHEEGRPNGEPSRSAISTSDVKEEEACIILRDIVTGRGAGLWNLATFTR